MAGLTTLRETAQEAFDRLWIERGWRRTRATEWLAERLGILAEECRIGVLSVGMCQRVVEICSNPGERKAN